MSDANNTDVHFMKYCEQTQGLDDMAKIYITIYFLIPFNIIIMRSANKCVNRAGFWC